MAVQVGDKFRSSYADSNALWRVEAKAGRGMWRCVIVEDEDYGGVVQGFTTDHIEQSKGWEKRVAGMFDEHEEYFANLPIGSIVHYDNGFGQFVRCIRVDGPKRKRLRPIAMVGNWDPIMDLPRRMVDGSVREGYQAEKIRTGECFEPNYGSIWERYDAKGREWSMRGLANTDYLNDIGKARFAAKRYQAPFDPTVEPAIDLTPPSMTTEAERVAALVRKVSYIYHLCSEQPDEATAEAYEAIIERVRQEVAL